MVSSSDSPHCDLRGLGVLVTRAAHQAGPLCELIEHNRGRPLPFPALEIRPPTAPVPALERLDRYHLVIFVSANAVEQGLALAPGPWPAELSVAAIGAATARALEAWGVKVDVMPGSDRYDSEALLALPALTDMSGRRVLILRGDGGRELLADELHRRGARVDYAEVYRRLVPQAAPAPLIARWHRDVQVVLATSAEVLENLARMLGKAGGDLLRATPVLVVSERMAERAARLGCRRLIRADGASDRQTVQALCDWVGGGLSGVDAQG